MVLLSKHIEKSPPHRTKVPLGTTIINSFTGESGLFGKDHQYLMIFEIFHNNDLATVKVVMNSILIWQYF